MNLELWYCTSLLGRSFSHPNTWINLYTANSHISSFLYRVAQLLKFLKYKVVLQVEINPLPPYSVYNGIMNLSGSIDEELDRRVFVTNESGGPQRQEDFEQRPPLEGPPSVVVHYGIDFREVFRRGELLDGSMFIMIRYSGRELSREELDRLIAALPQDISSGTNLSGADQSGGQLAQAGFGQGQGMDPLLAEPVQDHFSDMIVSETNRSGG